MAQARRILCVVLVAHVGLARAVSQWPMGWPFQKPWIQQVTPASARAPPPPKPKQAPVAQRPVMEKKPRELGVVARTIHGASPAASLDDRLNSIDVGKLPSAGVLPREEETRLLEQLATEDRNARDELEEVRDRKTAALDQEDMDTFSAALKREVDLQKIIDISALEQELLISKTLTQESMSALQHQRQLVDDETMEEQKRNEEFETRNLERVRELRKQQDAAEAQIVAIKGEIETTRQAADRQAASMPTQVANMTLQIQAVREESARLADEQTRAVEALREQAADLMKQKQEMQAQLEEGTTEAVIAKHQAEMHAYEMKVGLLNRQVKEVNATKHVVEREVALAQKKAEDQKATHQEEETKLRAEIADLKALILAAEKAADMRSAPLD